MKLDNFLEYLRLIFFIALQNISLSSAFIIDSMLAPINSTLYLFKIFLFTNDIAKI